MEREGVTQHIVKNRSTLFCMIYYSIWPIKAFEGCLQLREILMHPVILGFCPPLTPSPIQQISEGKTTEAQKVAGNQVAHRRENLKLYSENS